MEEVRAYKYKGQEAGGWSGLLNMLSVQKLFSTYARGSYDRYRS